MAKIKAKELEAAAQKKHEKLKSEFNSKLEDLVDWGYENNIIIDAYLKADHKGIFPYISFVYMTEEEKKQYEGWKKDQIKVDQELKKDPTVRKEA
jgi:hypothetical protein